MSRITLNSRFGEEFKLTEKASWVIQLLEEVSADFKFDLVLAGGVFKDILFGEEPKDYDIYFNSYYTSRTHQREELDTLIDRLKAHSSVSSISLTNNKGEVFSSFDTAMTPFDDCFSKLGYASLYINITSDKYGQACLNLIESNTTPVITNFFDITACKIWLSVGSRVVEALPEHLQHAAIKHLQLADVLQNAESTAKRVERYIKYGFTPLSPADDARLQEAIKEQEQEKLQRKLIDL